MKNLPLYKKYAESAPVAALPLSAFGGLVILDECEKDRRYGYVVAWDFGTGYQKIARHVVQVRDSRAYITKGGSRYYLDQFMRV